VALAETVTAGPETITPLLGAVKETVGDVVSTTLFRLKVAVTLRAAVIDTVQAPVPLHAPLQPEKV
jgi:hypothetical protein